MIPTHLADCCNWRRNWSKPVLGYNVFDVIVTKPRRVCRKCGRTEGNGENGTTRFGSKKTGNTCLECVREYSRKKEAAKRAAAKKRREAA